MTESKKYVNLMQLTDNLQQKMQNLIGEAKNIKIQKFDVSKFKELGDEYTKYNEIIIDGYNKIQSEYKQLGDLQSQLSELGTERQKIWEEGAKDTGLGDRKRLNELFKKNQNISKSQLKGKSDTLYIEWLQTGLEMVRIQVLLNQTLEKIKLDFDEYIFTINNYKL
jgi:hypothetical protein